MFVTCSKSHLPQQNDVDELTPRLFLGPATAECSKQVYRLTLQGYGEVAVKVQRQRITRCPGDVSDLWRC